MSVFSLSPDKTQLARKGPPDQTSYSHCSLLGRAPTSQHQRNVVAWGKALKNIHQLPDTHT